MIKLNDISDNLKLLNRENESKKLTENSQISFINMLKNKFSEVNDLNLNAKKITNDFALGHTDNIHQVMIATEKAKIAVDLTVAIQNKVVDAYKEIMRIQM